jgi:hypothetical protein
MSTSAQHRSLRRELARRVSGGLRITLYWKSDDNRTTISVYQPSTGETISFKVAPDRALDAFHHPSPISREPGRPCRWPFLARLPIVRNPVG